jgi:hypothetical protein
MSRLVRAGRHYYRDGWYTLAELAEKSGISVHAIRYRLHNGYSLEEALNDRPMFESVKDFIDDSYYGDWVGKSTTDLYEIYWKWCKGNLYEPCSQHSFVKQVMEFHPMLKLVPTKLNGKSRRIIRYI